MAKSSLAELVPSTPGIAHAQPIFSHPLSSLGLNPLCRILLQPFTGTVPCTMLLIYQRYVPVSLCSYLFRMEQQRR